VQNSAPASREPLFERRRHELTPVAEADIDPHASNPDFFVGFGLEPPAE
jgi:hypothetical protein